MIKTWRPEYEQLELLRCQRYCFSVIACSGTLQAPFGEGSAASTTNMNVQFNLPVPLYTSPTISVNMLSGLVISDLTSNWAVASVSVTQSISRPDQYRIIFQGSGSPLTQFRMYLVKSNNISGVLMVLDAGL